MDESCKKEMVRKKLRENKKLESLDLPKLQIASDYFTEEEINLKFKKPKKKVCFIVIFLHYSLYCVYIL